MIYATTITALYQKPIGGKFAYELNILFTVTGTDVDLGVSASANGNIVQQMLPANPDYIPFADITEADAMGWINAQTNNQVAYYESIDGQIARILNPPATYVEVPFPWVP